jgi:hypothetical protein
MLDGLGEFARIEPLRADRPLHEMIGHIFSGEYRVSLPDHVLAFQTRPSLIEMTLFLTTAPDK